MSSASYYNVRTLKCKKMIQFHVSLIIWFDFPLSFNLTSEDGEMAIYKTIFPVCRNSFVF